MHRALDDAPTRAAAPRRPDRPPDRHGSHPGGHRLIVVAHRGASHDEQENTLAAFERAIAVGAEWIEFDVQAAADGTLVVFHDRTLERLTPLRGPLTKYGAADLTAVGVPTLDEALACTAGRVRVMAELKDPWLHRRHDLVRRTVERLPDDAVVVSFSHPALLEAHRLRPDLPNVQHVGYGVSIRAAARFAWAAGFDDRLVTRRGIAGARAHGLRTLVYTVNEPARMVELERLGVDGIFSDRPDLALVTLGSQPPGAPPD